MCFIHSYIQCRLLRYYRRLKWEDIFFISSVCWQCLNFKIWEKLRDNKYGRTSPYEQNKTYAWEWEMQVPLSQPFSSACLSFVMLLIKCAVRPSVTKQCYKITQEIQGGDYKMMSDTCILIIYTSQEQEIIFFFSKCNTQSKRWAEWNACYTSGSNRRRHTRKICLCFSQEKHKFVILLSSWSDPSHQHSCCISKGNKLFWSRKKVSAVLSKKMRLGNFCILVRIFCFAQKKKKTNIKIKSHTFLYAFYKTGSHIFFLYPSYKIQSTKFQWED